MNINKYVVGTIGFVLGAAVGGFVTYKVTYQKLAAQFEDELDAVKDHYDAIARRDKTGPYEKLEDMARRYREEQINTYHNALRDMGYTSEAEADADPDFDKEKWLAETFGDAVNPEWINENPEQAAKDEQNKATWVIPEEGGDDMGDRDGEVYIISFEENDNSEEHAHCDKITVTYYEGDDTLADDRDEPIPDTSYLIGDDALNNFGKLSRQANVVYVHNERIGSDIEVLLDKDTYTHAVLGVEPEPKKPKTRVRKMKVDE